MSKPYVEVHEGVHVVRDDLFPGGTKARFLRRAFQGCREVVYASPAQGGAQTALATVAQQLGKRARIFVAARKAAHPRTLEAAGLGAGITQVIPGYLNVVQARARRYVEQTPDAALLPFGGDLPGADKVIASAALSTGYKPDEVWCAAGSGLLARGLAMAWPNARLHVVQVGREPELPQVFGFHRYHLPFGRHAEPPRGCTPPFPSDPHYDAKAWHYCITRRSRTGTVLFWNVAGPASVRAS